MGQRTREVLVRRPGVGLFQWGAARRTAETGPANCQNLYPLHSFPRGFVSCNILSASFAMPGFFWLEFIRAVEGCVFQSLSCELSLNVQSGMLLWERN